MRGPGWLPGVASQKRMSRSFFFRGQRKGRVAYGCQVNVESRLEAYETMLDISWPGYIFFPFIPRRQ